MDMSQFFDQDGLRDITSTWRDQHLEDGRHYGQIADVIRRRLEQHEIDGDGWLSAKRRARKVSKQVKRMEKASRQAAAAAEGLYATFLNQVVELPARRARQLEAKENRRNRLGIASGGVQDAVAKSLTKSAGALAGTPVGNPQVTPAQDAPRYNNPYPHQFAGSGIQSDPLPAIGDLFNQEAM